VMLAEASTELGGRVAQESRLPGLAEWGRVADHRVQQIKKMPNVDVFLDNHLDAEDALSIGADHIVVATGSKWRADGFGRYHAQPCSGLGPAEQVFTPNDILQGRLPEGRAMVFDDDHYYMGAVLAEALVAHGVEVCFVTPQNLVSAWGVMTDEQYLTQQRLAQLGVQIVTAHGLDEFDGNKAQLSCLYSDRTRTLEVDAVVLVTARTPLDGLYREISGRLESMDSESAPTLRKIGDCDAPAIIAAAVYAGHRYARELETNVASPVDVRYDKLFDKE